MQVNMDIPYNKPYLSGNELTYMKDALERGHISGNGYYTKLCHGFFTERYGFFKCLLTSSCTDALEMAAILLEIEPGDEVIMPAYTFVSTANAFALRGAEIVFCDSRADHPGMDESLIEGLVTKRTKAIVPVHYAGVACDMEAIMRIAEKHGLYVVEDAAQAVDSFFCDQPLGSIGHLGCFSFHETKNIISGEGGMLVINDEKLQARAEVIWEKGTNRSAFFRGEIDKYGWVDIGSSFLPSDITAAFLYAQLEQLDDIQARRREHWQKYFDSLISISGEFAFALPYIPTYATNNAHIFYIVTNSLGQRDKVIQLLSKHGIRAVFHYQSLNHSGYYLQNHPQQSMPNSERYTDCLLRLPLYYELPDDVPMLIAEYISQELGD